MCASSVHPENATVVITIRVPLNQRGLRNFNKLHLLINFTCSDLQKVRTIQASIKAFQQG